MGKQVDLTGERFGMLTVVGIGQPRMLKSGTKLKRWECRCDCGNKCYVPTSHLHSGHTKSCGCFHKAVVSKALSKANKKQNRYEDHGDYMIGYTQNNKAFLISTSDFEKVKDVCWFVARNGYIKGMKDKRCIFLHRLIMEPPEGKFVDHINHRPEDNRRNNLRIVSHEQNMMNRGKTKNNTSGCVGVRWISHCRKWGAYITANGKWQEIGLYEKFDDAVKARKDAEEKYYGVYSYDNSMKLAESI